MIPVATLVLSSSFLLDRSLIFSYNLPHQKKILIKEYFGQHGVTSSRGRAAVVSSGPFGSRHGEKMDRR